MGSNSSPSPRPNNQGYFDKLIKLFIALGVGAGIVALLVFSLKKPQQLRQTPSSTQAPQPGPPATSKPAPPTASKPAPPTTSKPAPPTTSEPAPPTASKPVPPQQTQVEVYYITSYAFTFKLEDKKISAKNDVPNKILQSAFEHLLDQPSQESLKSTIPQGTKLYNINSQNNEVYVDLSREFTTGGGSASMDCRLGQVIYTATSLNNEANVWIKVEGKPLTSLGGEGLMVEQPMTRQSFRENFSCL